VPIRGRTARGRASRRPDHPAPASRQRDGHTGTTPTHVLFVELKEDGSAAGPSGSAIGPA